MYGALWRVLPGPTWAKIVTLLVLAVIVLAICFFWFFPWISPMMPFNHNTVE